MYVSILTVKSFPLGVCDNVCERGKGELEGQRESGWGGTGGRCCHYSSTGIKEMTFKKGVL